MAARRLGDLRRERAHVGRTAAIVAVEHVHAGRCPRRQLRRARPVLEYAAPLAARESLVSLRLVLHALYRRYVWRRGASTNVEGELVPSRSVGDEPRDS